MKKTLLILLLFLLSCERNDLTIFQIFHQKVSDLSLIEDKQNCVNNFMKKLSKKDYPIFENDSTVVLLYKGEAKTVKMIGDLNYWTYPVEFDRVVGTDLHFLRLNINKSSMLEYWLIIDGETQLDSLNRYKVANEFGFASQIINHTSPEYFHSKDEKQRGLLKTYMVSRENNKYLKIHVYLPPKYNDYQSYPLAVLLDGKKYIELGEAPIIIDNLIRENKIEEIVAVFVELGFDIQGNGDIAKFYDNTSTILSNELLEFLENRFSVKNNPEERLLIGKSISGGAVVSTAINNLDKFGMVFCQSAYLSLDNAYLKNRILDILPTNIEFYFQIGVYERNVSHFIIPPGDTDFYQKNKLFADFLKDNKYSVTLDEFRAGHSWGNWKNHLAEGLLYYFSKNADIPG